ncbi:MAG: GDCCVxC domain-containing (seleno)protein [Caulobacteraceae bacterium]
MTAPSRFDEIVFTSVLTCPRCGAAHSLTMPADACLWRFDCEACGATLTPTPGRCCVFCSYGSVPCPPAQMAGKGDSP